MTLITGDSGSPLTIGSQNEVTQVGITSFGHRKCENNHPSVYTRMSSEMVGWINEELKKASEEQ